MPISKIHSKTPQPGISHNKKSHNQTPFPFEKVVPQQSENTSISSTPSTEESIPAEYTFESIEESAERLKHNPTIENALSFRAAVGEFLKTVVEKELEVEEHQSGYSVMRRKKYLLIVELRKNLDQLVEDIQKNYGDALGFLERINKIKGMLIDLRQ